MAEHCGCKWHDETFGCSHEPHLLPSSVGFGTTRELLAGGLMPIQEAGRRLVTSAEEAMDAILEAATEQWRTENPEWVYVPPTRWQRLKSAPRRLRERVGRWAHSRLEAYCDGCCC